MTGGERWDQPHSDAYTAADFHAPPGEVSQFTYDAITTRLGQRIAEKGLYGEVMEGMTGAERAEVEAAFERYGTEMRARGEPGW